MRYPQLDIDAARRAWHPIASLTDLVPRHVYHAQIPGRELALWRADDGHINAWENRCLHRGVRLSIGGNDGTELICQYHGWRYANRTAGCTYIPAHPADAPARSICNNTYPVAVRYGLVWSGEAPVGEPVHIAEIDDTALVLRPIPINASLQTVVECLQDYSFEIPGKQSQSLVCQRRNDYTIACMDDERCAVVFLLQVVDSNRTVLRGVVPRSACTHSDMALLRAHTAAGNRLRTTAEAQASTLQPLPPIVAPITPVAAHLAAMPEKISPENISDKRSAALRTTVQAIERVAENIKLITLKPTEPLVSASHPGAHIDIHLPNGLIRQYSLTNAPGQTDRFIIGVKRESESTGGSAHLHDHLKVGDLLATSEPRNNFPLRRDALNTVLIAGGIGITPLMSMAQAMSHTGQRFELHYFVQSDQHVAFKKQLAHFGQAAQLYTQLNAEQTQKRLASLLKHYQPATHCYLCGPPPMLDAASRIASEHGWPDDAIHIEYFKNTLKRNQDQAFEVALARSGLTLQVPAGSTLLDVLREHGIPVPSSCEQGACGTCKVAVLKGEPHHQDMHLSKTEKARGDCMMSCVSRAVSSSLTLDI